MSTPKIAPMAGFGAGIILIYSGVKGKGVLSLSRGLLHGQSPTEAAASNTVTSDTGTVQDLPISSILSATPTSGSEKSFWAAVFGSISAPNTQANQSSMSAWNHREEPSWTSGYANNPLNVMQNGVIGPFPSAATGVAATAQTLLNGNYPNIVAALKSGRGLCGPGQAADFATWSGGGYTSVC